MTRQQKTPRQRAQEQLDVAERHVTRLKKKDDALLAEHQVVKREYEAAVARRDYLKQHPDLGQPAPATTTSTGDNE